ncbi:hypothetical protein [uncultured Roseobacter sp.]|uniref:hypothetical protein n=1 Tax=uncultured Roseobacter sp. TaxID=114847 RepID=UPI00260F690C|nr:hypothetical protein [uncultured Roseobacter sp.]
MAVSARLKGTNLRGETFVFTRNGKQDQTFFNYAIVASLITVASGGFVPATSTIAAGQSVQDMANYATMLSPLNYETDFPGGTITSVEAIVIVGISQPGDYLSDTPLQEDDIVELVIRVTDSNGTVKDFDTNDIVVQPAITMGGYSVTISAKRFARVTIDPAFGGSVIAIVVANAPGYNGTYTNMPITSFDDGSAPYFFPGSTKTGLPAGRASVSEIVAGDELPIYPGLIAVDRDDVTVSVVVKADGVTIATRNSVASFDVTLTPSQNGRVITVETTASDGVNPPVLSVSDPITIPVPVSAGPLAFNLIQKNSVPTLDTGTTLTVSSDLTSVPAGDYCHAFVGISSSPALSAIVGLTVDGVPAVLLDKSQDSNATRAEAAAYRFQRGATATPDIVLEFEDNVDIDECALQIVHVANYLGELSTASDEASTSGALNLNLDVPEDGMVLAFCVAESAGLSTTFTGADVQPAADVNLPGDVGARLGVGVTTSAQTPRTVSADLADNNIHNAAVAVCIY